MGHSYFPLDTEPDTIYKSIKSLLPGQFLVYEKKKD